VAEAVDAIDHTAAVAIYNAAATSSTCSIVSVA
jgi:hypothetical protein